MDDAKAKVPQLITIRCDISKPEEREALYNRVSEQHKNLNMLMNNAGIAKRYLFAKTKNLEEKIVEEWHTNYLAPVMLTKQFLPLLVQNKGTVVNVTSGLAYVPLSIEPNYCATKAALHSMTQSLRIQLGSSHVKVIEIFYPAVDTPFQKGYTPPGAITPDIAAALALKGIKQGKQEIRIMKARLMYVMSRLMPKKLLNVMNSVIPENIEELLYGNS